MPIIGTAGHVDHGKSTLVLALTGRDPDRWAEEKRRGLTIDLGFAWTELEPGVEVGFVDVPGHQRFIKNMLAGAGGVDVALFVVAADEGWMPQSEEHMSVIELLGIHDGVIAATRADLADDDLVELAVVDIQEHVAGTALGDWPIVPVSAITGRGMDELRTALVTAIHSADPVDPAGHPRLWVDRSFIIHGAGTVVTGTLVGGGLQQGDELEVLPSRDRVRVRGIQSHEHEVGTLPPGSRAALNLAGMKTVDVGRGSLLVRPGAVRTTKRLIADVTTVRALEEPLTNRGAYHLHIGSGVWNVRLRLLGTGELEGTGSAVLTTRRPLPVVMGDRFILRETGRRLIVAGGVVLDPHPARFDEEAVDRLRMVIDGAKDERASVLLDLRGASDLADLAADSQGGSPPAAVTADGTAISEARFEELSARIRSTISDFEAHNPLRAGLPRSSLASSLGISQAMLDAVVVRHDDLVSEGAVVHSRSFDPAFPEESPTWKAAVAVLSASLAVPRARELGLDTETLHAAVRTERLVSIADDLVYLPGQVEEMTSRLSELPDEFVVGDFRDLHGLSRRQAVPLLEWLDARGWTSRRGDLRTMRRSPT